MHQLRASKGVRRTEKNQIDQRCSSFKPVGMKPNINGNLLHTFSRDWQRLLVYLRYVHAGLIFKTAPPGGGVGGNCHMKRSRMLIGKFEFNSTSRYFTPISNACYPKQLLTQLCCGDGMLHETIFNVTNKIQATMLQVFEWLSNTCNMLPQPEVALKVTLCAMLHNIDFN